MAVQSTKNSTEATEHSDLPETPSQQTTVNTRVSVSSRALSAVSQYLDVLSTDNRNAPLRVFQNATGHPLSADKDNELKGEDDAPTTGPLKKSPKVIFEMHNGVATCRKPNADGT